ncbi:hypothetical protein OE88DRAFT_1733804 [Heliocybe sulcata]|uniref:Transmembrane protein n=1 Tax=Heliocybe sulcata TaxID=5364 RepID=A0A5C3N6H7_9AGAM|nr:hypothetical protein OE88DRAFT_1733804 [Heliocybe sulcata]
MGQVQLDDTSPQLHYFGNWTLGGDPNNTYMGTSHYTTSYTSTMAFSFIGNWVSVYGAIGPSGINVSFLLDSGKEPGWTSQFNVTQADRFNWNQTYFASPLLPYGQHNLTMFNNNQSEPFVDYVLYNATEVSPSSTPSPSVDLEASTSLVTVKAGIAAAAISLLCTIAVLAFFVMRKFRALEERCGMTSSLPWTNASSVEEDLTTRDVSIKGSSLASPRTWLPFRPSKPAHTVTPYVINPVSLLGEDDNDKTHASKPNMNVLRPLRREDFQRSVRTADSTSSFGIPARPTSQDSNVIALENGTNVAEFGSVAPWDGLFEEYARSVQASRPKKEPRRKRKE